ncbi:MAG: hypothetical protein H6581_27500 [Bacteroidia bacterium]|nr:hypothetical protein [Bacteroidia bacterium]
MMKNKPHFLFFLLLLALFACNDDVLPPVNPYDSVDYGNPNDTVVPPDPNSIVGIHQNIFKIRCNNPGCHDGTFEPDFRTVQSTWTTLVYHKLVKNDAQDSYDFRVVPYDTSSSMLIRRLTRDDAQLQRMPATGAYLTAGEFQNIVNWINSGARDMFGETGQLPNNEPTYLGYLVLDPNFARIDTHRVDGIFYNPFIAPKNTQLSFAFLVEDDSTSVQNMQFNKVKFSTSMNDFSSAQTFQAVFLNLGGYQVWVAYVNTSSFTPGSTYFFRYYFNDGDHASNTEFPRTDHNDGYKTYHAMYVEP